MCIALFGSCDLTHMAAVHGRRLFPFPQEENCSLKSVLRLLSESLRELFEKSGVEPWASEFLSQVSH